MRKKVLSPRGFTLLELMMVVAIIALLAAIAMPHLSRTKVSTNDTLAVSALRALSTAAESYAVVNANNFPVDEASLLGATPPYIDRPYCGMSLYGFSFTCAFLADGYWFNAEPLQPGLTGTTSYTIVTGGVLSP